MEFGLYRVVDATAVFADSSDELRIVNVGRVTMELQRLATCTTTQIACAQLTAAQFTQS